MNMIKKRIALIAVIAKNVEDFVFWMHDNNMKPDPKTRHTQKIITQNNTSYFCISRVCDLKGYFFNDFIKTDLAHEGDEYEQIIEVIKAHLLRNENIDYYYLNNELIDTEPEYKPQVNEKKSTPHVCPVCGGNGLVSNGFYNQTSGDWSSISTQSEMCRTCLGGGIVWSGD